MIDYATLAQILATLLVAATVEISVRRPKITRVGYFSIAAQGTALAMLIYDCLTIAGFWRSANTLLAWFNVVGITALALSILFGALSRLPNE